MKLVRYTFHKPYVISDGQDYDHVTEEDKSTLREIMIRCLTWALEKGVIRSAPTAQSMVYIRNTTESKTSLTSVLTTFNLRTLVIEEGRNQFFHLLEDDELGYIWTELEQFAITLSVTYGSEYIDRLITRIYRSYDALPVAGQDMTWEVFHRMRPSAWIVFLIQNSILSYTKVSA